MPKPLIVAFLFLTRLPMPLVDHIEPRDNGRALVWFPMVGLVIGLLLWLIATVADTALPAPVTAAIVLALWCAITGGLHLDGLADSADAWLGGLNRERALEIMKDPRCGSAAVIAVCCLLLLKFAALAALFERGSFWPLILVPALARAGSLLLFLTTPYAREQGLVRDFINFAPRDGIKAMLIAVAISCSLLLGFGSAVALALIWFGLFYFLRRLMLKKLGGSTGDTAGSLVEILEAGVLIGLLF